MGTRSLIPRRFGTLPAVVLCDQLCLAYKELDDRVLMGLDNSYRVLFMRDRSLRPHMMVLAKCFLHVERTTFFLPVRLAITGLVLFVTTFMGNAFPAQAELSANQVMIVANANSRESLMVAEHYATSRGVPVQQIAKLDLPLDDTMSREDYDRRLVMPLRQALQDHRIQQSIRVLVTVYGVPLRVAPPKFTAEEQRWQRDASDRLGAARLQLVDIERRVRDIAVQSGSKPAPLTKEEQGVVAHERHVAFLLRVEEAVQESMKRVTQLKLPTRHQWSAQLDAVVRDHQGLAGLAQLHYDLPRDGQVSAGGENAMVRAEQLEGLQLLLGSLELPIRNRRAELYQQVWQVYGAYGVFGLAALELERVSDEFSDASVDSELSLLWWDRGQYGAVWRRPNPFHHAFKQTAGRPRREIPILMVSRLDAPTADLASRLVDRAKEGEQQGLAGTVYLDARGLPVKDQSDTYGRYDQSLRDLNSFLTQHTTYRSKLENTEIRFHRPGEAPDVALYVGWYQLRQYEDAFTFRPGAIGYHMASAEAVSLHRASESGWCKNALERGITATLGSIGEPYLDAFPEPREFVALLMTGQYSLVEAYYVTSRWISWRMVLVGDPLYNPWKSKPAAKRSSLTMFPLAPIAPSDRTFDDPILIRGELGRMHEQSRIKLDTILRDQIQSLVQPAP
ncbi:MAG: TIGR03790 family protein [Nitrospiraceae bacterium]|nr:TIGR03790 family protein [Nitrospiraceae bacterium]